MDTYTQIFSVQSWYDQASGPEIWNNNAVWNAA